MLRYFKTLLAQESPDYVISTNVVTYEQISCVTCKWVKNSKAYIATSFLTDSWIVKDFSALMDMMRGIVKEKKSIRDISNVLEFADVNDCRNAGEITEKILRVKVEAIKNHLQSAIENQINSLTVEDNDDIFTCKASISPFPAITVTVTNKLEMLGTFVILIGGVTSPCLVCSDKIYHYIEHLSKYQKACSPILKLQDTIIL